MPAPTVVHEDGDLQVATWSRVLINRWRTAASPSKLDILRGHMLAHIDATDDRRIVVLTTLEDRSGLMPNSAARKKAEEIARTTRDAQVSQAQVVAGDGFVAASFRALLSGITLAIRAPYPTKVFKSEAAALPWLEEQLRKAGYETDAAGIAAAVRDLRWADER